MNNSNPFVPQGSFLEHKNKARARLKIAVFSSISLSVVALTALLIQGCRKPAEPTADEQATNTLGTPSIESNLPTETNALNNMSNNMVSLPPEPPTPPALPPPVGQEYTVIKGDTFATIAKSHHVSVKAIQDANPNVDPKKLQIGQKLQIPASTSAAPGTSTMAPAPEMSAGGAQTYKVKSGDTLTSVAKQFHTTIKAIQSANNMTTTSIRVGQVLKIPLNAAPAPAPVATPVEPPASLPAATTTNH